MYRATRWLGLILFLFILTGCQKAATDAPLKKDPEVVVVLPTMRSVIDYENFTGKTDPSRKVDLQARVTGYLDKTFFAEGALVEENALLFQIDQRPYKIEVERAEANLASGKASLGLSQLQEARQRELLPSRAGSREDYDKVRADLQVAKANTLVAEANLKKAKLDLEWTEMRAPFAGRISRWNVDPGNLIKPETILATLVAIEPMYVTFDADERTVLRQLIRNGLTTTSMTSEPIRLEVGLVDEPNKFPHPALLNFVDSRLDSGTGSLWLRATLAKSERTFLPGMFSRVRFPLGPARDALCIPEQALMQNQGDRSVFVVTAENKIETRARLVIGGLHEGQREIKTGLKLEDRVVISGLQRVKDGMVVKVKEAK